MGKNNGYIFVWRQLRENPFYTNSKAIHIWLECLFRATYKERAIYKGRDRIELESGEFIMGYREFGEVLNIGTSTVKYWLDKFEDERMIERKSNAKGTKVKVLNWDDYQDVERILERSQNADETQIESNNKGNKDNSFDTDTTNNQSDSKSDDSPKFDKDSTPYQLAKLLYDRLTDWHDPVPGKVPDSDSPEDLDKWSKDIDKLLRLGPVGGDKGPDRDQVEYIIHWIYDINDFWRNTIESPHGIRKNLSKITAQIREYKRKKSGRDKFQGKSEKEYIEEL